MCANFYVLLQICIYALTAQVMGACEYTQEEKSALLQVRLTLNDTVLYRNFMKTDKFLISWLKAKKMNPTETVAAISKSSNWRIQNSVDHLIGSDDLKCATYFPSDTLFKDKRSRPIWLLKVKLWDMRKAAIAGRIDQFVSCTIRTMEILASYGRAHNETENHGQCLHQCRFIADLNGFNIRQHACPGCVAGYVSAIRAYEDNYPMLIYSLHVINAPAVFQNVLALAKSVMTQETRERISVFSFDQRSWRNALLDVVPSDQLPIEYGGSGRSFGSPAQ